MVQSFKEGEAGFADTTRIRSKGGDDDGDGGGRHEAFFLVFLDK